jgi:tripartite-type tricarboxylate transporter receptor subunit TctC
MARIMDHVIAAALVALMSCGLAGNAAAQAYPTRPITLVVPFSAGGPSDTIARVVGARMSEVLGQRVVIENIGGAAGTIATARVARAAPDGYTLDEATWSTYIVSPVVYPHLSYDVLRDFAPVVLMTGTPLVILSKKSVPAGDLSGLIAWLKANPNKAFEGVAGGTDQVAGYLFKRATGTQFQSVPYRGLALAMQDLVAGRIDLLFDQPSDALPQIHAGNVRAYAVTAKRRLSVAPGIPTVDEAGLPGVYLTPWQAIWAPKGTPDAIIAKLNAAAMTALADPAVRKRLSAIAQEVVPRDQQSPAALAALYKSETRKWWPIIKAAGLKMP